MRSLSLSLSMWIIAQRQAYFPPIRFISLQIAGTTAAVAAVAAVSVSIASIAITVIAIVVVVAVYIAFVSSSVRLVFGTSICLWGKKNGG